MKELDAASLEKGGGANPFREIIPRPAGYGSAGGPGWRFPEEGHRESSNPRFFPAYENGWHGSPATTISG